MGLTAMGCGKAGQSLAEPPPQPLVESAPPVPARGGIPTLPTTPIPVPKLVPDPIGGIDPTVDTGAGGAVATVQRYYAALDRHDYDAAHRLWEGDGQASGQTLQGFRQGFAHTAHTRVTPGPPGAPEGAAGSSYITVPVAVAATLDDGTHQRFTGSYVLRRVDDVPGSSAGERRWHLHSATLKPA